MRGTRIRHRVAVVAVLATALVACGGGGGGGGGSSGPPSTPIAIASGNAASVAGEAADALLQVADSSSLVGGAQVASNTTGSASLPLPVTRLLSSSIKRLNAAPSTSGGQSMVVAAAVEQPCAVSGSFVLDQSSSTSATLTFNNCSDIAGETVNGQIVITGINGTATNFSASVSVSLMVSVTGQPTLQTTGSFALAFSQASTSEALTLNGSSLSLTSGSHVINVTNFNIVNVLDTGTGTFDARGSFTIASTRLNGSVGVSVGTDFHVVGGREHASQGVLTVSGAGGTRVRVTALGDETAPTNSQVQLEIDTGSGSFGTPISKTWADLDA